MVTKVHIPAVGRLIFLPKNACPQLVCSIIVQPVRGLIVFYVLLFSFSVVFCVPLFSFSVLFCVLQFSCAFSLQHCLPSVFECCGRCMEYVRECLKNIQQG